MTDPLAAARSLIRAAVLAYLVKRGIDTAQVQAFFGYLQAIGAAGWGLYELYRGWKNQRTAAKPA